MIFLAVVNSANGNESNASSQGDIIRNMIAESPAIMLLINGRMHLKANYQLREKIFYRYTHCGGIHQ